MICFHDWYVHKNYGPKSFRYWAFINSNGPTIFISAILTAAIGISSSHILYNLFDWTLANKLLGFVIGLMACFTYIFTACVYGSDDYDPWRLTDKACLQCGLMKFDATKAEKKNKLVKARRTRLDKISDAKAEGSAKIRGQKIIASRKSYSKMLVHYSMMNK